MAKIILDKELGEIVHNCITDEFFIDDGDQYIEFLEGLARLVCEHFGGDVGNVSYDDDLGYSIAIHWNDSLMPGGGPFENYDTDVKWTGDGEVE